MKNVLRVISLAWMVCGCATQMVEHNAEQSCKSQGKKAFMFDAKQSGIPLVIESASAMVICVGPDEVTHLPESFGADAVSGSGFTGAGIVTVAPGSVADKAKVKANDIVMEFAGSPIVNARELGSYIERVPAGGQAVVKLRRQGKELVVTALF